MLPVNVWAAVSEGWEWQAVFLSCFCCSVTVTSIKPSCYSVSGNNLFVWMSAMEISLTSWCWFAIWATQQNVRSCRLFSWWYKSLWRICVWLRWNIDYIFKQSQQSYRMAAVSGSGRTVWLPFKHSETFRISSRVRMMIALSLHIFFFLVCFDKTDFWKQQIESSGFL